MFSVAPNILLAPNMTQNAERKHRTQNTNTAHFRSLINFVKCARNVRFAGVPVIVNVSMYITNLGAIDETKMVSTLVLS